MEAMNLAVNAATTPAVQMWMNWILLIFAVGLIFVWRHNPARLAVLAFFASVGTGYLIFTATQNVWLLGIPHLIFWAPLAVYLWFKVIKTPNFTVQSAYGIWVILLLLTILISLVFDVRDLVLVFMGEK